MRCAFRECSGVQKEDTAVDLCRFIGLSPLKLMQEPIRQAMKMLFEIWALVKGRGGTTYRFLHNLAEPVDWSLGINNPSTILQMGLPLVQCVRRRNQIVEILEAQTRLDSQS